MKYLIADSGSTKTRWALVDHESGSPMVARTYQTIGLNPLYTKPEQIAGALTETMQNLSVSPSSLSALYFYGAGCNEARTTEVENALYSVLDKTTIEVNSDLLGACRALRTEICCIMGTGSIAALYDTETNEMGVASSLGYILGDEGSGVWFGRQVLSDYLKLQMPVRAREVFEEEFGEISAESAVSHVYRLPFPNRYLAQFAPFVGRHLDKTYCQKLAFEGVDMFFRRNIMRLQPQSTDRISFVGSVAFALQEIIKLVAESYNLQTDVFLKEPMDGLIDYHYQHNNLIL